MENSKDTNVQWALVILLVLLLIIIYVSTLGKVNISDSKPVPEEFKDSKEQAKRRHQKLKELIEKQEALKEKLTKRFKVTYFFVRIGFVVIWGLYLLLLFKVNWVNNLEDILNYSEAAILVVIAMNFLTFGSVSNLNNFIDLIKIKLQNWVWDKYLNIDHMIESNKTEMVKLKVD